MYLIKKTIESKGKKIYVLMTNGYSEILEIPQENLINKLVEVLNENSDSGCSYEVISVNQKNKR